VTEIQPIFVSVKEAARILGLTTWSVYQLCDQQKIVSQYHGRRRLVRVDSLHEYADSLPDVPPAADVTA
jgi:excisionase family DNA binding protein